MNILDPMQSPDLRSLRLGFYKLVYIRPTQLCPARCRHCSARAEPGAGLTTSLEQLSEWVPSIASLPGLEWIGVEGGEPFFVLPQLCSILQAADACGVSASVVTNAYWAVDGRRAEDILSSLPRIQLMIISADEFHAEHIPLGRVVHAVRAARGFVDRVAVQTCAGPGYPRFLASFREEAGEELWKRLEIIEAPLAFVGRATESGIMARPESSAELPDAACFFLGTPVVREDGAFIACCQQDVVLSPRPTIFHLGNIKDAGAANFKTRVDADIYFQTLRVFGPKAIAEAALKHDWGWRPRTYLRDHNCDLCMDLAAHPRVVDGFRKVFDTPEYWRKLALGRSVIYGEPLSELLGEKSGIDRNTRASCTNVCDDFMPN